MNDYNKKPISYNPPKQEKDELPKKKKKGCGCGKKKHRQGGER